MAKDSEPESQPQPQSSIFYRLTPELAQELRSLDLSAAEWRLWSYLVTLDPFGDQYQVLPDLLEVLTQCGMSKATFYRAIAKFEEARLFDTQPLRIAFRNLRGQKIVSNLRQESHTRDKSRTDETEVAAMRQASQICENHTPESPETRTNKQNRSNLLEEQTGSPPSHPVENGQGVVGTSEGLLSRIERAGVKLNKTIRGIVAKLASQLSPAAAVGAVENAISALLEQQAKGTVRNPGGFLVAALRGNFTANHAKKVARERSPFPIPPSAEPSLAEERSLPTRASLNIHEVAQVVDQAVLRNDRAFALARLQALWSEGWQSEIEELCILRKRDWGFRITAGGVKDAGDR